MWVAQLTCCVHTVNPLLSPQGGLFFSSTVEGGGGLKKEGGILNFNLAKCINGSKVSRGRTCGYQALYCFFKQ